MNEFNFAGTLDSLKTTATSAPILGSAWVVSWVCEVWDNRLLLIVPFLLVFFDFLFALIRVKLMHYGGFESRKYSKSVGKLCIYYVLILTGWCIDKLLVDANIIIVCDHSVSWSCCAFLSIGEWVSILASMTLIFPNNVGLKLLSKLFKAEIASKLEKWGVSKQDVDDAFDEAAEATKQKVTKPKRKSTKKQA